LTDFADSNTFRNLLEAFSRSAQAAVRYQRFARTAEYEQRAELAELFARLAENETLYAHGHLDFIRATCDPLSHRPFGGSGDNLAAAAAGEHEDATGTLPIFSRMAEAEGLADVASWFRSLHDEKANTLRRLNSSRGLAADRPDVSDERL
jgi:rubrerythrin